MTIPRHIRLIPAWLDIAGTFLLELSQAAWATFRAVLRGPEHLTPAILAVPLDLRSAAGITLFANMVSLTPGTTSLEVSRDRRVLYVHCLDAPDPSAGIRRMKFVLERKAGKVFG